MTVKMRTKTNAQIPFYLNWQFYTAISGLILSVVLAIYLYSINNRMALIQEASFRPALFVTFISIEAFPEDSFKIDSIKVKYKVTNKGGNTAFYVELSRPGLSIDKILNICEKRQDIIPPYTSLPAGDSLKRNVQPLFLGSEGELSSIFYIHFCARYRDLMDKEYRSYFVIGLKQFNLGNSVGYRKFDEMQMID